jgi:hypothetical protein
MTMPTASQPTTTPTARRPRRARRTVVAARVLVGLLAFAVNGAVCLVLPGAPPASDAQAELADRRAAVDPASRHSSSCEETPRCAF